jgi:hypothetical protein
VGQADCVLVGKHYESIVYSVEEHGDCRTGIRISCGYIGWVLRVAWEGGGKEGGVSFQVLARMYKWSMWSFLSVGFGYF